MVIDTLLPRLTTELDQMKSDMESEGYKPRIVSMPRVATTSQTKSIWDTLVTEYDKQDGFLAGAILVGAVTGLSLYDRPFWFMTWQYDFATDTAKYGLMHNWEHRPGNDSLWYDFDANNAKHIWISRLVAVYGEPRKYGKSEADQLKRYFKANHEYRKGITRFQRKAYFHMAYATARRDYFPNKYLPLFTSLYTDMRDSVAPRDYSYSQGGELLDAQYHGNNGWYHAEKANAWLGIWTSDIYEYPMSIRFSFTGACNSGGVAGIANSSLYTRNGGCLLAVAAAAYAGTSVSTFAYKNYGDKALSLLSSGERWGRVFIRSGAVKNINMGIYGDLTLKPGMAADNKMPLVTSLTADHVAGIAPLTVRFSAAATDSDGSISGYEWYPKGFNYGMDDPSDTGRTKTATEYTYTKPYLYKARVEALDNYNARARAMVNIAVAPSCADTMRVNVFAPQPYHIPSMEYVDSLGRTWMHDQQFAPGTWGYVPRNFATGAAFNANYVPYRAKTLMYENIIGTKAPTVFRNYLMPDSLNPVIWYKITVPNGSYRLNLGFADCRATTADKKATIDIEVEGQLWRSFSPFDSVGAKKACFVGKDVVVSDYELEFKLVKSATSTDTAFLNCFELYSLNPGACISLSEKMKEKEKLNVELKVNPNPFNPSTVVSYYMPVKECGFPVSLKVFSADGKCVRSLFEGTAVSGNNSIVWNGRDNYGSVVTSGLYIVRISTKSGVKEIKTLLLK
jgi:hypothetical protein